MSDNLFELPENLPVPIDDGACVHLLNTKIPAVCLPATSGRDVCLAKLSQWSVLYCYPLTGNWQTWLEASRWLGSNSELTQLSHAIAPTTQRVGGSFHQDW